MAPVRNLQDYFVIQWVAMAFGINAIAYLGRGVTLGFYFKPQFHICSECIQPWIASFHTVN